jgi:hypothetical protein
LDDLTRSVAEQGLKSGGFLNGKKDIFFFSLRHGNGMGRQRIDFVTCHTNAGNQLPKINKLSINFNLTRSRTSCKKEAQLGANDDFETLSCD